MYVGLDVNLIGFDLTPTEARKRVEIAISICRDMFPVDEEHPCPEVIVEIAEHEGECAKDVCGKHKELMDALQDA